MKKQVILVSIALMSISMTFGQALTEIKLSPPRLDVGKTLMEALNLRSSHREFSTTPLSDEHLSNLLWAACGINRPETGKRTAPSSNNWQDVSVYVAMPNGIYRYHEKEHLLTLVKEGDHRAATGKQEFVSMAPINLIYVSDYNKMSKGATDSDRDYYGAFDAGLISQNVYLYCASIGLNTVVRAMVDKSALHQLMGLTESQHVVVCQTIGYVPEQIK